MERFKIVAIVCFAAIVIGRFVYVLVKTVRITVLKVDPPMRGYDSEPATNAAVQEALEELSEESNAAVELRDIGRHDTESADRGQIDDLGAVLD